MSGLTWFRIGMWGALILAGLGVALGVMDHPALGLDVDRGEPCAGPDADGDAVADVCDNCETVPNAGQEDVDGDLWGDACDAPGDHDHNGRVSLHDFATFAVCFGLAAPGEHCDATELADADLDGTGEVDLSDFQTFVVHFTG